MIQPLLLFAHGAGAPSSSPWMLGWRERLSSLGTVVSFDYPYMQKGRKLPDPLPALLEAHRAALQEARARHPGPVVLIGKSMGSRVGCHLALEEEVGALVCLGYPLVGAGKKAELRDEVLIQLRTPILFVQGSRDELCPLELLEQVRARMQTPNALHVVEDGDHSLELSARFKRERGITQEASDQRVLEAIGEFLGERARGGQAYSSS